jgi:hypothetical protein
MWPFEEVGRPEFQAFHDRKCCVALIVVAKAGLVYYLFVIRVLPGMKWMPGLVVADPASAVG